jgi:hypothetical protein
LLPTPVDSQHSKREKSHSQPTYQEEWREERRSSKTTSLVLAVNATQEPDNLRVAAPSNSSLLAAHSMAESSNHGGGAASSSRPLSDAHHLGDQPAVDTQMSDSGILTQGSDTNTTDTQVLESQMREIQSRVEMLSTEMTRYMTPPAYEGEVGDTNRIEH